MIGKLAQVKIGLFMRSFPRGVRNYFVCWDFFSPVHDAEAIDSDLISHDWFMHPDGWLDGYGCVG